MDAKSSIFVCVTMLMIASLMTVNGKAVLRRVPKVYNALITTDDNLLSSQAIPIIQPSIHETGVFHYALHPYSFVNTAALKPPSASGYIYPTTLVQFPPQLVPQHLHPQLLAIPENHMQNSSTHQLSETKPTDQMDRLEPTTESMPTPAPSTGKDRQNPHKNLLPIPLHHHELPPSLLPPRELHAYNSPALRLPPYTFSQYSPVLYDPIIGLHQPYLPPIDYLPNNLQIRYSNNLPLGRLQAIHVADNSVEGTTRSNLEDDSNGNSTPRQNFVKNGSRSADSNIPDIPPPPIPIKSSQTH